MRQWVKRQWFRYIIRPRLRRNVQRSAQTLLEVNHLMVQAGVGRKMRRMFFRELWRNPNSAYEIIERALYGRVGYLEEK